MSKITQTPMSGVDLSWLRMDTPENPMMISSVLIFDAPIAIADLKRVLNERFLKFRRFRQRVVEKSGKVYWQNHALPMSKPSPLGTSASNRLKFSGTQPLKLVGAPTYTVGKGTTWLRRWWRTLGCMSRWQPISLIQSCTLIVANDENYSLAA